MSQVDVTLLVPPPAAPNVAIATDSVLAVRAGKLVRLLLATLVDLTTVQTLSSKTIQAIGAVAGGAAVDATSFDNTLTAKMTVTHKNIAGQQFTISRDSTGAVLLQNSDNFQVGLGRSASVDFAIKAGGACEAAAALTSKGATGGVGYSTGAGGTVVQATNKTTAVTLNRLTGQITTANSATVSGVTQLFTVNNSAVAATDVVLIHRKSGGTAGVYFVFIDSIANGSFVVGIQSVGALSEAVVLQFAVIKGVNA